jgi:hypothetical protein
MATALVPLDTHLFWHRRYAVPEISRFFGIVITMYFNDHDPPHFHVKYGHHRATVAIDSLRIRQGELPARVLGLVIEWAQLHRAELRENWTLLQTEGTFKRISPLE